MSWANSVSPLNQRWTRGVLWQMCHVCLGRGWIGAMWIRLWSLQLHIPTYRTLERLWVHSLVTVSSLLDNYQRSQGDHVSLVLAAPVCPALLLIYSIYIGFMLLALKACVTDDKVSWSLLVTEWLQDAAPGEANCPGLPRTEGFLETLGFQCWSLDSPGKLEPLAISALTLSLSCMLSLFSVCCRDACSSVRATFCTLQQ